MDSNAIKNALKLGINSKRENSDNKKTSIKNSELKNITHNITNNFNENRAADKKELIDLIEPIKSYHEKILKSNEELLAHNKSKLASTQLILENLEKYLVNILKNQNILTNNQSKIAIYFDNLFDKLYFHILKSFTQGLELLDKEITKKILTQLKLKQHLSELILESDLIYDLSDKITKRRIISCLKETTCTKMKFIDSKVYLSFASKTGFRDFVQNIGQYE